MCRSVEKSICELYGLVSGQEPLIPYSLPWQRSIRLLTVSGALVAFLSMVGITSPSEQGCEHRLQSSDEIIRFFVTLQERGDLRVLHFDLVAVEIFLLTQESVLAFEQCDPARHVGLGRTLSLSRFLGSIVAVSRAWARRVGHWGWLCYFRDMVRHLLLRRTLSHFVGQSVKLGELFDSCISNFGITDINTVQMLEST